MNPKIFLKPVLSGFFCGSCFKTRLVFHFHKEEGQPVSLYIFTHIIAISKGGNTVSYFTDRAKISNILLIKTWGLGGCGITGVNVWKKLHLYELRTMKN